MSPPIPPPAPPALTLQPGTHCPLMCLVAGLLRDHRDNVVWHIVAESLLQNVDTRLMLCASIHEQLIDLVYQVPPPAAPETTPQ